MNEEKPVTPIEYQFYLETLIAQKRVVDAALIRNYGNISKTALELNINRGSLRKLIKENKAIGLRCNKDSIYGK